MSEQITRQEVRDIGEAALGLMLLEYCAMTGDNIGDRTKWPAAAAQVLDALEADWCGPPTLRIPPASGPGPAA